MHTKSRTAWTRLTLIRMGWTFHSEAISPRCTSAETHTAWREKRLHAAQQHDVNIYTQSHITTCPEYTVLTCVCARVCVWRRGQVEVRCVAQPLAVFIITFQRATASVQKCFTRFSSAVGVTSDGKIFSMFSQAEKSATRFGGIFPKTTSEVNI